MREGRRATPESTGFVIRIGAQPAVLATIQWVFLFWRYRDSFAPLYVAKANVTKRADSTEWKISN